MGKASDGPLLMVCGVDFDWMPYRSGWLMVDRWPGRNGKAEVSKSGSQTDQWRAVKSAPGTAMSSG